MLRSLFGRAAEDDADAEHFDHWQTTDLCWSAGAERRALARWRLWGRRMGGERKQVRKSPRRLPAAYLPEMGAARRAGGAAPPPPPSRRAVVLEDLRSKGHVVANGGRYGGDYVCYEGHPDSCHSSETVRVVGEHERLEAADVAAYCRVQGNVSKRAVFAAVDPASHDVLYVGWAFDAQLSRDPLKRLERRFARKIQDDSKVSVEAAAGDGLGPEDCARLTVAQLREALEARGLDATGLKAALQVRLYDALTAMDTS
tara:strand:- start:25 stop:795 length:771 start_codon:yes stop_codon:yes gene_type:complete